MSPYQSLHLPEGFPPGLARIGNGLSSPQRSPNLSESRCMVSRRSAPLSEGILCSILLSYAEIVTFRSLWYHLLDAPARFWVKW